jgi:hypothetical protein
MSDDANSSDPNSDDTNLDDTNSGYIDYIWNDTIFLIFAGVYGVLFIFMSIYVYRKFKHKEPLSESNKVVIGIILCTFLIYCIMVLIDKKKNDNSICKLNPNKCMHDGECTSIGSDLQKFTCACKDGWIGEICNTPDNLTIHESDIDNECNDKVTGEKTIHFRYCDNLKKCIRVDKFKTDCAINIDGTPNFKYNPHGCDIDKGEIFCDKTDNNLEGECIQKGSTCKGNTIEHECSWGDVNRNCLRWDNDRKTCINKLLPDNQEVYNYKMDKCNIFNCNTHNNDKDNCNSYYCEYSQNTDECNIKNVEHCQSNNKLNCNNECTWDDTNKICITGNNNSFAGDCNGYDKINCENIEHCKFSNNTCMYDWEKSKSKILQGFGIHNDINTLRYTVKDNNNNICPPEYLPDVTKDFNENKCVLNTKFFPDSQKIFELLDKDKDGRVQYDETYKNIKGPSYFNPAISDDMSNNSKIVDLNKIRDGIFLNDLKVILSQHYNNENPNNLQLAKWKSWSNPTWTRARCTTRGCNDDNIRDPECLGVGSQYRPTCEFTGDVCPVGCHHEPAVAAPDPVVTESDTAACTLDPSTDLGVTPGTCADADSATATCEYVEGTHLPLDAAAEAGTLDTVVTADSCTSTTITAGTAATCSPLLAGRAGGDLVQVVCSDQNSSDTCNNVEGCKWHGQGTECARNAIEGINSSEDCTPIMNDDGKKYEWKLPMCDTLEITDNIKGIDAGTCNNTSQGYCNNIFTGELVTDRNSCINDNYEMPKNYSYI